MILESTSETVIAEYIPGFKGIVPYESYFIQIGIIRIYARKQPEKKSIIKIKMKVSTSEE